MVPAVDLHPNPRLLTATLSILLVATLLGCSREATAPPADPTGTGPPPTGDLTQEQVCARPDAQVRYPGATELRQMGSSTNVNGAFCGLIFATPDPQEQVHDYFTTYALDHGYTYISGVSSGGMFNTRSFRRPPSCRELIVFGTDAPDALRSIGVNVTIPSGTRTVFEYTYTVRADGRDDCPTAKPIPRVPSTIKPLLG
jgi:hypothetical protein